MKYYSEATVNEMILYLCWSGYFPVVHTYPSIEIPEQHGDLIDKNYLKNNVSCGGDPELGEFDMVMWDDIENAPIVIKERK